MCYRLRVTHCIPEPTTGHTDESGLFWHGFVRGTSSDTGWNVPRFAPSSSLSRLLQPLLPVLLASLSTVSPETSWPKGERAHGAGPALQ